MNMTVRLDAERVLGSLAVGEEANCNSLRIVRVSSPFPSARYAVYRDDQRMTAGDKDDLFSLSEAAASYASEAL
jgi:hypothetical protein